MQHSLIYMPALDSERSRADHASDCPTGNNTVDAYTDACPACGPKYYARHAAKHRRDS